MDLILHGHRIGQKGVGSPVLALFAPWEPLACSLLESLDRWIPSMTNTVGQLALEKGDLQTIWDLIAEPSDSPDLIIRWQDEAPSPSLLIYLETLVDTNRLTLSLVGGHSAEESLLKSGAPMKRIHDWKQLVAGYLAGEVVLLKPHESHARLFDLSKSSHRSISKPTLERSIRGPQESFVEPIDIQLAQIRRRLQSPLLHVESFTLGSTVPTTCMVICLDGVASPGLVATVHGRLNDVPIDSATNATRVGSLIRDSSWALFPTLRYTERVDLAALAIEQGKVAILVDGDPSIITVPATLADFYRTSEDYSTVWYDASFMRIIRLFAWGFGLFLPGMYIALTEVNPDLISPTLFDLVAGSHTGLPFTPFVEVVVMILVIEILREAALRLPQGLGSTLGTVGAIVVGTAVVKAGFVSPQIIVLMTLTALSLFSVPAYELLASWRLISWAMLLGAFVLGIYGMVILTFALSMTLINLSSFGTPYLTPIAPWRPKDWANLLWRVPWSSLRRRLTTSKSSDLRWQGPG